jgi:hypothetical protein
MVKSASARRGRDNGQGSEKRAPHTVLPTAGSKDGGGLSFICPLFASACRKKNAVKDLVPTGFGESGVHIVSLFLGRNEMSLGGHKDSEVFMGVVGQ